MKKFKKIISDWRFILSLIFLLGLGLRLWQLGTLPRVFFLDEVLSGYVGRYILTNGVDIYNHSWPKLYFNNFGDYYIIGPMYLDGLSTLIFGANEFAVRLPTALFGALLVPVMYALIWLMFSRKRLALFSALFVAISPWHIVLSRATTESVIELTLLATMIVFLLLVIKRNQARWLFVALVFGLLGYLTYHTARVLTPLIWLGFFLAWIAKYYRSKIGLKKLIFQSKQVVVTGLGLMLVFFGLTFYISKTPWGKGRFDQTSIFSEQSGVSIRMTEMTYNLGNNNVLLARIFHNKLLGYGREFIHQYLSYFDPNYLFLNGWQKTRYAVPEAGPNYLIFGLLAIVGFVTLFHRRYFKLWSSSLVLWLLAIAVVPAAFTVIESPNVRRSLFLLLPLILIISLGADFIFEWLKHLKFRWLRLTLAAFLILVLLGEVIFFWYHYQYQADLVTAYYRKDGFKQVVEYVSGHKSAVDKIYLPSRGFLPVQYLFYTKDFDKKYASQFKPTTHLDQLDNLYFINDDCPSGKLDPNEVEGDVLVVDQPGCESPKSKILKFKLVDEVFGVDQLLKFKVYKVGNIDRNSIPKTTNKKNN